VSAVPLLRRAEILLCIFFAYASVIAAFRPVPGAMRARALIVNAAVIVAIMVIARLRPTRLTGYVRDWLPVPLILLAYRVMGWMAQPHTSTAFEDYWVVWDRRLLDEWGLRAAIESLGPVLPNLLELSYLVVYSVPFAIIAAFYLARRREPIDEAHVVLLVAALGSYALYPWFPSEPPRTVFPDADLPVWGPVRWFNLAIVDSYGIHTSVFPSGHSAAAFGSAFAAMRYMPEKPWFGRGFLLLAVLIAVATVYGRYHYAVDAAAGLGMALLALAVARVWGRR
jgi:membrane-associated phospholipid phosphatase